MTVKQIQKLKTPRFIQQIESTLKPLQFLDSCAKNYGDIFLLTPLAI
jgi:cytochrome P450 family 110